MTPDFALDIFRQAVYVAIMMISVIVVPGLVVGLIVAMFQAATQINEMSLSFVPKIIITFLALLMAGPWLLKTIMAFTQQLITGIPDMIG